MKSAPPPATSSPPPPEEPSDVPSPDMEHPAILVGFLFVILLGFSSALLAEVSIFVLLILVIALAATTRLRHERRRQIVAGLTVATVITLFSLSRFVLGDALPGIVEARGRATSARAVSLLREILFAQDAMRRYAFIDPDADGIGSAGLLGELAGADPLRSGQGLEAPVLAPRYAPSIATGAGPALQLDGYLYLVCLPGQGNEWTSSASIDVDDERAERRWQAYAWPDAGQTTHAAAYFIDQHERILESQNQRGSGLRLVGPTHAPSCDDVSEHPAEWTAWRDKKPRDSLVGDR